MKKESIGIIIVILLIPTLIIAEPMNDNYLHLKPTTLLDDHLDQSCWPSNGKGFLVNEHVLYAQGFTPSYPVLTRVKLGLFTVFSNEKDNDTQYTISIREQLETKNMVQLTKNITQIEKDNGMFDLKNNMVTPGHTYYIVLKKDEKHQSQTNLCWEYNINDKYKNGDAWISHDCDQWQKINSELNPDCDFCFNTYGIEMTEPDLSCTGSFIWENVTPKEIITGEFQVYNNGGPHSQLNWSLFHIPSWGEWDFDQVNGTDLTPNDGPITIHFSVISPEENHQTFKDNLIIVNNEDLSDFEKIPVRLTTPKTNYTPNSFYYRLVINRFIQRIRTIIP